MIECVGAAGAGKSFLCDKVLEILNESGVTAKDLNSLAVDKLSPRNLCLTAQSVWLTFMTRPKSFRAMRQAVKLITRYMIRRDISARRPGIYITSEGLFHRIISLQRGSRGAGMLQLAELLLRRIQIPDVLIIVEARAEVVLARRSARNRTNDRFSADSVRADIAMTRESNAVARQLQGLRYPELLVIRVSMDAEGAQGAVEQVLSSIDQVVRGGPGVTVMGA